MATGFCESLQHIRKLWNSSGGSQSNTTKHPIIVRSYKIKYVVYLYIKWDFHILLEIFL